MKTMHRTRLTRRGLIQACAAAATASWAGFATSHAALFHDESQAGLDRLRRSLDGDLVLPSSDAYEAARRPMSFNPRTNLRPAAIAYCASPDDVARSLDFARTRGLPVAARSGGCDILGRSSCDRGVVIDLSLMNEVVADDVNTAPGLARIGAGATAGLVNDDLAVHGRAAALGCDPMVGIGGLTLGGGLGWLLGRDGAACDSLVAAQLVTADGRYVEASAEADPDLLWGLKGGGGNFGVVTQMTLRTTPTTQVVGGYLVWPIDRAEDVLLAYPELMRRAPRDLMVELAAIDTARGLVLVAMTCFSGRPEAAPAALAPFRAVGAPIADDIGLRDYRLVGAPSDEMIAAFPPPPAINPGAPELEPSGETDNFSHWRGASLAAITPQGAACIIDAMRAAPPGGSFGLGHVMKGAALEAGPEDSALLRTPGAMCAYFSAAWRRSGEAGPAMGWVDAANAALAATAPAPTYVNYLASDAVTDIAAAYGPAWPRLRALKARMDPDNVFDHTRAVPPG